MRLSEAHPEERTCTYPERLDVPVLVLIQPVFNHRPAHRIEDNVEVIRHFVLVHWVLEEVLFVCTETGTVKNNAGR